MLLFQQFHVVLQLMTAYVLYVMSLDASRPGEDPQRTTVQWRWTAGPTTAAPFVSSALLERCSS